MKDRVPTRPGRVLITPENGGAPFYATVVRADEPTENGDPMSKATFLQDATAALYGLGPDAVPDDVLVLLKKLVDDAQNLARSKVSIEIGSYVGTGTVGSSDPNTLVFSDVPALIFMYAKDESNPPYVVASSSSLQPVPVYILDLSRVGTDYGSYSWGHACVCKKSPDGRTVQWYCNSPSSQVPTYGAEWQFNNLGTYYYYFAITKTRI